MLSGGSHDDYSRVRGGSILSDSGSDAHVCRPTFALDVEPMFGGPSPKLVDVQPS